MTIVGEQEQHQQDEGAQRRGEQVGDRLPEPTRREVTISYLLFRIADTFEDSASWTRKRRIRALEIFCDLLANPRRRRVRASRA